MSDNENMELETKMEPKSTEPATTSKAAEKKPAKTDGAKKQKPVEKKKRGLGRFLREMKGELKKVVWPTRKQTVKNTGIVIVCVVIVGAFVWIFDGVAGLLIGALLKLFGG